MVAELPEILARHSSQSLEQPERVNIAQFLPWQAARTPQRDAVLVARGLGANFSLSGVRYAELEARSNRIARALLERGMQKGDRVCLFVRAGVDLIAITFALMKAGAVPVLIDPGLGRRALLACVERMQPRVFIGIPLAHALKRVFPGAFATVEITVSVGHRWLLGGETLEQLCASASSEALCSDTSRDDQAAVLFTSGSTGAPKGVTYTHGNFHAQVLALQELYSFEDGEVDAACFPLFALFSPALAMTCVFPEMNPSQPARCDPERLYEALSRSGATSTFGSPAIWRRVAPWCLDHGRTLPKLRRILIAGAPVSPQLVESLRKILAPGADVHTPYGATESLPVSSISGAEILGQARVRAESGAGTCVGFPAPGIEIAIVPISEAAMPEWDPSLELAPGELGEIVVKGPQVTSEYKFQPGPTALAKIADGECYRHRMGDVGCFDSDGRLWFAGRKSHRLETNEGLVMPVPIENLFNSHACGLRTALVGIGARGQERPVLIVELPPSWAHKGRAARRALAQSLRDHTREQPAAKVVSEILFHPRFPVDVRHNAKIKREELKLWAEEQLA